MKKLIRSLFIRSLFITFKRTTKVSGKVKLKPIAMSQLSSHAINKAGLHYAAYACILQGWKAEIINHPVGGDYLEIRNYAGTIKHAIKVKTLTNEAPLPLGTNLEIFRNGIIFLCLLSEGPEVYIFKANDILFSQEIIDQQHKGAEKGYWALNNKSYWNDFRKKYRRNWALLKQVH